VQSNSNQMLGSACFLSITDKNTAFLLAITMFYRFFMQYMHIKLVKYNYWFTTLRNSGFHCVSEPPMVI
jgi:hypothetical protein